MIETPQVIESQAQLVAAVHIKTPRSRIQRVMGPGIGEAMACVQAQRIGPVGPWFAHHLKTDSANFEFDICVPVSSPVAAVGRVKSWQRPAVKVVRTVYHGPYEGLDEAWGQFWAWIDTNRCETAPDFYECYLVGPETSSNPADWRTELSRPLIEQAPAA
jgi:effector-binding domain-containing protein